MEHDSEAARKEQQKMPGHRELWKMSVIGHLRALVSSPMKGMELNYINDLVKELKKINKKLI